jgi:hypothetical protein
VYAHWKNQGLRVGNVDERKGDASTPVIDAWAKEYAWNGRE